MSPFEEVGVRFTLAIIAALANAAGPWLCCCAMSVMIGSSASAKADTPFPVKKSAPKCSHCLEAEAPAPKSSPEKPAPTKPCPCQERQAANPTTVQPVTEVATTADAIAHDFHAPAGFLEVVIVLTPSRPIQTGWPFLTTETRLHVHHVLRC